MPTYTYVCDACGNEVEAFQSMSDEPLKKCPACKKNKLRRTFHPVGIVLKGSGFHKTDYRTNRKSSSSKESSGESKSGESKSGESTSSESTSSDTKTSGKKTEPKKTEPKS